MDSTPKPPKLKLIRSKKEESIQLPEFIRPELNLEKWPTIWQSAKSKNRIQARTIKREESLPNGNTIATQVRVSANVDYGYLTTEDQKVYYALIHLWELQKKPTELRFSIQQIAGILGKSWGKITLDLIKQSLLRLRSTLFVWENAYYDKPNRETIAELNTFTILSDLYISKKKKDSHATTQKCRAQFYPLLDANLRANHTLPTSLKVMIGLKNGVAQLLYKHLELRLYKNTTFERCTQGLFEDLCLEGEEYRKPSVRKRVLEAALSELQELPMRNAILTVELVPTNDRTDYKIVAKKRRKASPEPNEATSSLPSQTANPTTNQSDTPRQAQSRDLVRYFLTRARIGRITPQAKELAHAETLIETYDLSPYDAEHFVDRALKAATTTGFAVQTFGGLMQYAETILVTPETSSETEPTFVLEASSEHDDYERLEKLGAERFAVLDDSERTRLLTEELAALKQSDKWEIYARWSKETLTEHLSRLVGKRLAAETGPAR